MTRKILLRGKQIDTKEWVEGYFIEQDYPEYHVYIVKSINIEITDKGTDILAYDIVEVDPETICQYTGLTDKNNKKFEGDIFQTSDEDNLIQRYVITWNEDKLEWFAQCITDPNDGTFPLHEFEASEIDVIGNIFENPELLKTNILFCNIIDEICPYEYNCNMCRLYNDYITARDKSQELKEKLKLQEETE